EYLDRAAAALRHSVPFVPIGPWYADPGFVSLLAARVTVAREVLLEGGGGGGGGGGRSSVIFTAHSLPERILQAGDSYPDQLAESARLVAGAAGLGREDWSVAWQSAG